MLTYYFLIGLNAGICLLLGIYFIAERKEKMPYQTAFGFQSLVAGLSLTIQTVAALGFGIEPDKYVNAFYCIDFIVVPFYIMEISCIAYQDVKLIPWYRRWTHIGVLEFPILGLLAFSFASDWEGTLTLARMIYIIYGFTLIVYMVWSLSKFKRNLRHIRNGKNQNINWVIYIYSMIFAMFIFYSFAVKGSIVYFYLICNTVVVVVHSYFIYHQAPTDTTRMEQMELARKQAKIIADLRAATESIKETLDIDSYIKTFETTHPDFAAKLQNSTPNKLTRRDIFLCILIFEGRRNSAIAEELEISVSSVEVARHRLRAKLNLDRDSNLNTFVVNLSKKPLEPSNV